MRIAFVYNKGRPDSFIGRSFDLGNFGGSEGSMIHFAYALTELGHDVCIYIPGVQPHKHGGVEWRAIEGEARFRETFDVVIALRFPNALEGMFARVRALYCCDPELYELPSYVDSGEVNLVIVISEHHKHRFQQQHPIDEGLYIVSNAGVVWSDYDRLDIPKMRGRAIYCSVPGRGLEPLGSIWPMIHKEIPWATLHITGSLKLWGLDVPPSKVEQLINLRGVPGVTYLGLISREVLIREQLQSQVLLLPGEPASPEMCCMSAMECAAARNLIIVCDIAALSERVIEGRTGYVVRRECGWEGVFAQKAVGALTHPYLSAMQGLARGGEREHDYAVLASKWVTRFEEELSARR